MSKEDIIKELKDYCLNEKIEITKSDLSKIYDKFIKIIKDELDETGDIRLHGLGTFSAVIREEKQCRNPQSGEMITVPRKKRMKFKASKTLLDQLNEKEEAGAK
ncbi:HU family DNA-binding protein [Wolbachia endosymbiont (group E) of Neria commutata]|uniref:HU family DNA-binding protein n=1 Tax=Wolbachia endosymbiont (group E) of Neria commutata TaxID=3066149 RepID=UPI0031329B66